MLKLSPCGLARIALVSVGLFVGDFPAFIAAAPLPRSQWPALIARYSRIQKAVPNVEHVLQQKLPALTDQHNTKSMGAIRKLFIGKPFIVTLTIDGITRGKNKENIVTGHLSRRQPPIFSPSEVSAAKSIKLWYTQLVAAGRALMNDQIAEAQKGVLQGGDYGPTIYQTPKQAIDAAHEEFKSLERKLLPLRVRANRILRQGAIGPLQFVTLHIPASESREWKAGQTHGVLGVAVGSDEERIVTPTRRIILPPGGSFSWTPPFLAFAGLDLRGVKSSPYIRCDISFAYVTSKIPHAKPRLGPITGYAFHLKSGEVIHVKHYTMSGTTYQVQWHGIEMDVFPFEIRKIVVKLEW